MKISDLTNENTNSIESKRGKLNFKLREILNLIEIYQKEGGVIHRDEIDSMDTLKKFVIHTVKDDEKSV